MNHTYFKASYVVLSCRGTHKTRVTNFPTLYFPQNQQLPDLALSGRLPHPAKWNRDDSPSAFRRLARALAARHPTRAPTQFLPNEPNPISGHHAQNSPLPNEPSNSNKTKRHPIRPNPPETHRTHPKPRFSANEPKPSFCPIGVHRRLSAAIVFPLPTRRLWFSGTSRSTNPAAARSDDRTPAR
jgi:hypothetical protein